LLLSLLGLAQFSRLKHHTTVRLQWPVHSIIQLGYRLRSHFCYLLHYIGVCKENSA
jgi:hypothetical protein